MKISVLINTHKTDVLFDTIDSVKTYVTKNIVTVVDGHFWDDWGVNLPQEINPIKGFVHNFNRAPYKNYTLGLQEIYSRYPDSDWYCYIESDVLFTNDNFKNIIIKNNDAWMLGNDKRIYGTTVRFPYLDSIMGFEIKETAYFLGCCVFFNKKFIEKLVEIDFFNKFLDATKNFKPGYFPDCDSQNVYDIGENLYPTLAHHYGGKLVQLANWNQKFNHWCGDYFRIFPMRWKPDITWEDNFPEASIMHPIKNNSEIRTFHKLKRQRKKIKNV